MNRRPLVILNIFTWALDEERGRPMINFGRFLGSKWSGKLSVEITRRNAEIISV
jgi:hypothetical protein